MLSSALTENLVGCLTLFWQFSDVGKHVIYQFYFSLLALRGVRNRTILLTHWEPLTAQVILRSCNWFCGWLDLILSLFEFLSLFFFLFFIIFFIIFFLKDPYFFFFNFFPNLILMSVGTVFPNTDRVRLVKDIFIFFSWKLTKFIPKEPQWFRAVITARSSVNWTIFERVNGS